MTIAVFYSPYQSVDSGSYSPSSAKPAKAMRDWEKRELDIKVLPSYPASRDNLCLAHSRDYVDDVLDGRAENGFGTKDLEVAESLRYTVGSMIQAATFVAIAKGNGKVLAACSPTSGFHHAGWDWGGGFCTFNGLMSAAVSVLDAGLAKKVGILDYDYHYGNGTANIITTLGLRDKVFHYCAGNIYTTPSSAPGLLRTAPIVVQRAKDFGCDLILYQAGADQHVDDPLGGVLTTSQLLQRDKLIFDECRRLGLPVVWNFAGGYQRDKRGGIPKVLTIHRNTMKACSEIF